MILNSMPVELVAGDTLIVRFPADCYPIADWTLEVQLAGPTPVDMDVTEGADGYTARLDADDSEALAPGVYKWFARFTGGDDDETITACSGKLEVTPNPADLATDPSDQRSWAEKALEAIETQIAARGPTSSFSLFGRTYSMSGYEELLRYRDYLARQVAREHEKERRKAGKPGRRTGFFRFPWGS